MNETLDSDWQPKIEEELIHMRMKLIKPANQENQ